jgi:hypothetical protein
VAVGAQAEEDQIEDRFDEITLTKVLPDLLS